MFEGSHFNGVWEKANVKVFQMRKYVSYFHWMAVMQKKWYYIIYLTRYTILQRSNKISLKIIWHTVTLKYTQGHWQWHGWVKLSE